MSMHILDCAHYWSNLKDAIVVILNPKDGRRIHPQWSRQIWRAPRGDPLERTAVSFPNVHLGGDPKSNVGAILPDREKYRESGLLNSNKGKPLLLITSPNKERTFD